jgi:hypothetical protein
MDRFLPLSLSHPDFQSEPKRRNTHERAGFNNRTESASAPTEDFLAPQAAFRYGGTKQECSNGRCP